MHTDLAWQLEHNTECLQGTLEVPLSKAPNHHSDISPANVL